MRDNKPKRIIKTTYKDGQDYELENGPNVHELKCWPGFYNQITGRADVRKTFEVRHDDRPKQFKAGDLLILKEWDPMEGYTGRACMRIVTMTLRDADYVPAGKVVMGLADVKLGVASTLIDTEPCGDFRRPAPKDPEE